jgi:hypothetical protein
MCFDIVPCRSDTKQADDGNLPVDSEVVEFIFIDLLYSDNIKCSDHIDNIGNISCEDTKFFEELDKVTKEIYRILKP